MDLTKILLEEIHHSNGYTVQRYDGKSALLIPREGQRYYMPDLVVRDLEQLEDALKEYIEAINNSSLLFYKIDDRHKMKNYLFYLIKSLTNTDCQDFISYIRRFTTYLKDNHFTDLYYSQEIGKMDKYNILARRCEEYYGSETPFTLKYYAECPGFKFEMPLVRYGISSKNEAYIYSIQRKRIYHNKNCRIKEINSIFNGANSGVKHNRDITPAMLCSLVIFVGMLQNQGVRRMKADGFLTRRYRYFNGVSDEEERNQILHNSVDKFNKLFLRLVEQFNGIDIVAYPFDIDSYFHLLIAEQVNSNNETLNQFYNMGLNYQEKQKTLHL